MGHRHGDERPSRSTGTKPAASMLRRDLLERRAAAAFGRVVRRRDAVEVVGAEGQRDLRQLRTVAPPVHLDRSECSAPPAARAPPSSRPHSRWSAGTRGQRERQRVERLDAADARPAVRRARSSKSRPFVGGRLARSSDAAVGNPRSSELVHGSAGSSASCRAAARRWRPDRPRAAASSTAIDAASPARHPLDVGPREADDRAIAGHCPCASRQR